MQSFGKNHVGFSPINKTATIGKYEMCFQGILLKNHVGFNPMNQTTNIGKIPKDSNPPKFL